METSKNTTAGVLVWTPAPAHTSSTSSIISEDAWEDEDEERAEKEDDFVSQMDENGIIGLFEALKNVDLGKTCGEADTGSNPGWFPTLLTPEEADPSGQQRDPPSEEPSYSLSNHPSDIEFPGEDVQILSPCDDTMGSLKACTEDEQLKRNKVEKAEDKQRMSSGSKRKKNEHTSGACGATSGMAESYINKEKTKKISSTISFGPHSPAVEPAGVSNHHSPLSKSATAGTAPILPHLLHFTAEEIAAAPLITAETFPEMGFIESLAESLSSKMSLSSTPRCPPKSDRDEQKRCKAAAIVPEVMAKSQTLKTRQSPDRDSKTPRARTKAAEVNESRKGPLNYRMPDFSKVEPRVRFPKSGYKPPKSKLSSKMESLAPGPPILFKSPADIVKEALMDTSDGPPAPSPCAPNFAVPEDFRCRQQATTLFEQLQEGYNRLLTKYAEAENTIDRLRLEAKVNLYSDPPKPRHSVELGQSHDVSQFMTLDFPQAQRAEIKSASCLNGHSSHKSLQEEEQVDKVLCIQADKFLQQLQTFGDIMKGKKLKPFEQMKGLSQLAEGLDSLERGYLLARDEHRRLQQQQPGTKISNFDPERELEGLIYQCGLHMDELKEQVEEMQQEQPMCKASPSPSFHPILSSVPFDEGEVLTHPQTPPVPLLVGPGKAAQVEVSSASEEDDEKESDTEDEETLKAFYLKPLTGKHRCDEQDFATLMDHSQSFRELPKIVDLSLREETLQPIHLGPKVQPGNEKQDRHSQGSGNAEVQESRSQRKVKLDHQDSPPPHTSKQQTTRFSRPSHRPSTQTTTLPVHSLSSSRSIAVRKSHSSSLSSLGEIIASEQKNSKPQTGSRRVDGIISPETDSGFVGSESSHLTPGAAPSSLHQRPLKSVSGHQEGRAENPQTGPVSAPSPATSPSHSRMNTEPRGASHLIPDQTKGSRQGQRRRTFSCSPQRWVSQTEESSASSGTSGLESDTTHSTSEDRQFDQFAESINSVHSSKPRSSPSVPYYHGDPLRALGRSQVANCNDAMQSLQAEVSTLKERLERLRHKNPLSSVGATASAQDKYTAPYTFTPHIRLVDRQESDVIRGRRQRQIVGETEELRRTTRTRSASSRREKSQPDILTGSELRLTALQPQPQMSRYTQTSATAPDNCCSCSNTLHSRARHPRQHRAVSVQVSETGDEPDRSCQAPLCPQCSSHHRGQAPLLSGPTGGSRELDCLCGRPNPYRSCKPDSRIDSDPPTHTSCQPAESSDQARRNRYVAAAAPPAVLQCMPVCPPPFLVYSLPVCVPRSNRTGMSSGVRSRGDVRGRTSCSLSADKQQSLDSSLSRAIRSAQHMKHTSRRMARSLATGLQYQELLSQSCNY